MDDIVKGVSQFTPVAIMHPEESPGKIVERAGTVGALADEAIGIQPKEHPFAIIILCPLPTAPALWTALSDDGVIRGIFERTPSAAGIRVEVRAPISQGAQGVLLGDKPGAC